MSSTGASTPKRLDNRLPGNRVEVCRREVVKVEESRKPEKNQVYQESLETVYDRLKEREVGSTEEE